ncbi:hypothetical protein [Azospirillum palustre]
MESSMIRERMSSSEGVGSRASAISTHPSPTITTRKPYLIARISASSLVFPRNARKRRCGQSDKQSSFHAVVAVMISGALSQGLLAKRPATVGKWSARQQNKHPAAPVLIGVKPTPADGSIGVCCGCAPEITVRRWGRACSQRRQSLRCGNHAHTWTMSRFAGRGGAVPMGDVSSQNGRHECQPRQAVLMREAEQPVAHDGPKSTSAG